MSKYMRKMIDWVLYMGTDVKPSESISDARWRAMCIHLMNNHLYINYPH